MTDENNHEATVREFLQNADEQILCLGGAKHVPKLAQAAKQKGTVTVLTDRALYVFGPHLERAKEEGYKKRDDEVVIPFEAIDEISVEKKPPGRHSKLLGRLLLFVGTAVLVAGLVEGSAFGIVVALFIGAAWLMVPGALVLLYAKAGGSPILNVRTEDRDVAILREWFTTEEIEAIQDAFKNNAPDHRDDPPTREI